MTILILKAWKTVRSPFHIALYCPPSITEYLFFWGLILKWLWKVAYISLVKLQKIPFHKNISCLFDWLWNNCVRFYFSQSLGFYFSQCFFSGWRLLRRKMYYTVFSWIFHWTTLQPGPGSRDIPKDHLACPASGTPMPQSPKWTKYLSKMT